MRRTIFFIAFLLVFSLFSGIFAQEALGPGPTGREQFSFLIPEPPRRSIAPEFPDEVPRQFRDLYLGMSLGELKFELARDGYFAFRGDRDVSFLPVREETLVETTGVSYISRANFHLINGEVYIMAFALNTRLMDHYSVFTAFVRRYGEPDYLSPREAVWETDETRVSIERPLTVKYIDKIVFDRLIEESRVRGGLELLRREEFLDNF